MSERPRENLANAEDAERVTSVEEFDAFLQREGVYPYLLGRIAGVIPPWARGAIVPAELFSETYVRVRARIAASGETIRNPRGLFIRAAFDVARTLWKQHDRRRRKAVLHDEFTEAAAARAEELARADAARTDERVRSALEALDLVPDPDRTVFRLVVMCNKKLKVVARLFGMSLSWVSQRRIAATKRIRELLDQPGREGGAL